MDPSPLPASLFSSSAGWFRHLSISDAPVNRLGLPTDDRFGARLEFLGIVRGIEAGRPIRGIRYSAYRPMAEKMLAEVAEHGERQHPPHLLRIHHVTGFVAAGEPSIAIEVAFPHSAEALAATAWYLKKIKEAVPIWKEPLYEST